ncbi:MAG: hypothetical protein ABJH04_03330 [Cyclobacteriaceae bacterium]
MATTLKEVEMTFGQVKKIFHAAKDSYLESYGFRGKPDKVFCVETGPFPVFIYENGRYLHTLLIKGYTTAVN